MFTAKTKTNTSSRNQCYYWLIQHATHCRLWLIFSVLLGIFNGLFIIGQAYLLATIFYQLIIFNTSISELKQSLMILFALIIIRASFLGLREMVNFKTAQIVKKKITQQLIQHIFALGPVRSAQFQAGATVTIIMEQVEALHDFFANYLPQMALVVILPVLLLIFVFSINWLAGLLLFITAPLIPAFMAFIGIGAEAKSQRQFQYLAKMSGYFLEVLKGLLTLKLFQQSKAELKRIAKTSDNYRKATMNVLRIAFLSSAVLELFSSGAIAMLAVYLGLGLLGLIHIGFANGLINLKQALFILLLAPEFFLPLRQLGVHYHARAQAIGAAEEIRKLLAVEANNQRTRTLSSKMKVKQSSSPITIELDQVSFGYQQNHPILNNLNCKVNPNEHIIIAGESGIGKSTILNLLMKFITPDKGVIRINKQNLESIAINIWLQSIAWIGQNTRLFFGSLRDNIVIAKPNATVAEITQAIQFAYLEELIQQLPLGLETKIGEQNYGLSQGQVQRIALSRAYLKNAPILLLDEPTANLDTHTENIILAGLEKLIPDRTVITVSHRQQTIQRADRLLFLTKDGLTESKTFVKKVSKNATII